MSDRANRLREQRNQSKDRVRSQASESSKPSETDKPVETGEGDGAEEPTEPTEPAEPAEGEEPAETDSTDGSEDDDETDKESVKDEQVGTYFYLPEGQHDELRYQYKMLSAEYEREFGEDLEKNRHFYPLVIQYGLGGLDSADAQDVRDMLGRLDY